jgi:hypothetical protein
MPVSNRLSLPTVLLRGPCVQSTSNELTIIESFEKQ